MEEGFKINEDFAKRYNKYRRREELQKLKELEGPASDSSSESEDDTAEAINPKLEKDFFHLLAKVKTKDPEVYEEDKKFFSNSSKKRKREAEKKGTRAKKEKKPLLARDYEAKVILEGDGIYEDDEQAEAGDAPDSYYGQLAAIKRQFTQAAEEHDQQFDNNEAESLLTVKPANENSKVDDEDDKLDGLDDYWKDPKLNEKDKFLRDYFLEKKYLGSDSEEEVGEETNPAVIEDIEDFHEKQEVYEYNYNTRFEDESEKQHLKSYPRNIQSVRKKDERRKTAREQRKVRKAEEKKRKMEELARLKRLKREEILEKIERLKMASGNTDITFEDRDIDDDFEPEEHDKRMQALFNDHFYEEVEDEKPRFSDEEDEYLNDVNGLDFDGGDLPDCERDDFIMDCDYTPTDKDKKKLERWKKKNNLTSESMFERAIKDNTVRKVVKSDGADSDDNIPECEQEDFNMDCDYEDARKSKRQLKKEGKMLRQLEKHVTEPGEKSVSEHLEEYYAMDYDDLIGDMPVRFKYRKVLPNDFGLRTEDILVADDRTLNMWCPLKRVLALRRDEDEFYLRQKYRRRARSKRDQMFDKFYAQLKGDKKNNRKPANEEDSAEALPSENEEEQEEPGDSMPKKKNKPSARQRMKMKQRRMAELVASGRKPAKKQSRPHEKKRPKDMKRNKNNSRNKFSGIERERLAAYGIKPGKKKK